MVVDATVGGGGHAEAILEKAPSVKLLIGLDRDMEAVERARKRLARFGERAIVDKAHFADIGAALDRLDVGKVDAVIMDLGVSSFHLDDAGRGFSFRLKGPLDMRMDKEREITAADIVNTADEKKLASIFREFGEERYAARIAKAIVRERRSAPIEDTLTLAGIVERAVPKRSGAERHPATRVFQALRIAVNEELDRLGEAIESAVDRLNPGGRIVVISFHSLEDRIVKNTLADMKVRCVCPKDIPVCVCGRPGKVVPLTKKPVTPSAKEIEENPRARSAKLRAAERLQA